MTIFFADKIAVLYLTDIKYKSLSMEALKATPAGIPSRAVIYTTDPTHHQAAAEMIITSAEEMLEQAKALV